MSDEKKEDEFDLLGESKNLEESKKKKKKKKKKNRKKKDDDKKDKKLYANDKFILNGIYRIIKMVGCGAFGEIHLAYDVNMKALRAIKFEMANHKNPQLKHEYSVLEQLNKHEGGGGGGTRGAGEVFTGVPKVYYFDRLEHKYNFMVMEFLGPSLGDLFQLKERNFGMETVLMIAIQVLSRIEYIHEKGFIHRDIKPENFVIGLNEKSNLVYLIDYGLSKRYKDKNSGQHIPYRENKQLVGTVRYASVNAHLGIEQSRRDDLEGIGYVLVYFYLGRLPWQNKTDKGKPLTQKITEKKLTTPPELLCKKMPREFSYYFHYCKNLKFEDRPDYNSLKSMFADLLMSRMKINGIKELIYDWFDEENAYRERKKKEMISSSNNKSEILKYEEDQSNVLNKIEEKEDNKEESNLTGTIGKRNSNVIEEEKQENDNNNINNNAENQNRDEEKNDKSSISSESEDAKKNEENNNNINNDNNKENENGENNGGLIKETSEQKSSDSYGILGNDDKKKDDEDKKNNSKNDEDDDEELDN